MQKYNERFNKNVAGISHRAIALLENYNYPGNVRELENIIERAIALTSKDIIQVEDLPKEVRSQNIVMQKEWVPLYLGESLATAERKLILATIDHFAGNRHQAAKVLGLSERHLRTKLKQYLNNSK